MADLNGDGPLHPKHRTDQPPAGLDTAERARVKVPTTRFEAHLREAKLSAKGEYVLSIVVPWEDAEKAKVLMDHQGIMLDWRVTRKPM